MEMVWRHMKEALAQARPSEAEKNTIRAITIISEGPATFPNHFKSVSNKISRTANTSTPSTREVRVVLHNLSQDAMTLFRTEKAQ